MGRYAIFFVEGLERGREPDHRHHPVQGKEPDCCSVRPSIREEAHRRRNLPGRQTPAQGAEGPTAKPRADHKTAGGWGEGVRPPPLRRQNPNKAHRSTVSKKIRVCS